MDALFRASSKSAFFRPAPNCHAYEFALKAAEISAISHEQAVFLEKSFLHLAGANAITEPKENKVRAGGIGLQKRKRTQPVIKKPPSPH